MDLSVPERPIEPPPGWADAEYPTAEDEEEGYLEKGDRWDDED